MSTIFAGGYRRGAPAECPNECQNVDSQKYRLSEYHYSKLAGSQSLNKCRPDGIENQTFKKRAVRRCLSAPDFAPFLNCNNCQGIY